MRSSTLAADGQRLRCALSFGSDEEEQSAESGERDSGGGKLAWPGHAVLDL